MDQKLAKSPKVGRPDHRKAPTPDPWILLWIFHSLLRIYANSGPITPQRSAMVQHAVTMGAAALIAAVLLSVTSTVSAGTIVRAPSPVTYCSDGDRGRNYGSSGGTCEPHPLLVEVRREGCGLSHGEHLAQWTSCWWHGEHVAPACVGC